MQAAIVAVVPSVQVRGVPEDVHRRLKAQAALAGQSLNEFLLARLRELASLPTVPETRRSHSRPGALRRTIERRRDPRGARRPVIVLDASVLTDFLLGRVWQLRHNLTAYDAAYLALAEALDDPLLMTADAGLASAARASLGAPRVRQLS